MSSNESSVQAGLQVFPVILAAGNGERFWPLHRRSKLKQFLNLDDSGLSLIRVTINCLMALPGMDVEAILITTEVDQRLRACERLPYPRPENLLVEPAVLDAMTVLYAALEIVQKDPNRLMGDFYSDQLVDQPKVFIRVVCQAAPLPTEQGIRVTTGIEDIYQSLTHRYIERREQIGLGAAFPVYQAVRFTEKLAADHAGEFLDTGRCRFNSGMLVWKARAVLGRAGDVLLIPDKVGWDELTATSDLKDVVVRTIVTFVIHDKHPQELVRQLKADPHLERYV